MVYNINCICCRKVMWSCDLHFTIALFSDGISSPNDHHNSRFIGMCSLTTRVSNRNSNKNYISNLNIFTVSKSNGSKSWWQIEVRRMITNSHFSLEHTDHSFKEFTQAVHLFPKQLFYKCPLILWLILDKHCMYATVQEANFVHICRNYLVCSDLLSRNAKGSTNLFPNKFSLAEACHIHPEVSSINIIVHIRDLL